jgi:hypothetical protein
MMPGMTGDERAAAASTERPRVLYPHRLQRSVVREKVAWADEAFLEKPFINDA